MMDKKEEGENNLHVFQSLKITESVIECLSFKII